MTQPLRSSLSRLLVVIPTLMFSSGLNTLGVAAIPRLGASLAVGAVLIVLVARWQRRRAGNSFHGGLVVDATSPGRARTL